MAQQQGSLWTPENDRRVFFWLFLLGAAFIWAFKEWIGNQFVVTAIPCCLMLGYAALVWDFAEKRPRSDFSGDNLYYLGFLYTLTSLGHSLFRFSLEEENAAVIVTNFGIAIFSTILGMALRVLLGRPGGDDPASVEASARRDLADSARALRDEMDYIVQEFVDFREKARKNLEQTFAEALSDVSATFGHVRTVQEVIEKFEKDMREVTGALGHQARALGKSADDLHQFKQAVTELEGRIGATVSVLRQHTEALNGGADAVSGALEMQVERINKVDFLQALVDHAGAAAATQIGATTDKFSQLLDQLREGDERSAQALVAGQKAMAKLHEALSESRRLSQASIDAMTVSRDVAAALESTNEKIRRFNDSVHEVVKQMAVASDLVAPLGSTGRQSSLFNDTTHEVTRALTASGEETVQFRKNIKHASEELTSATAALAEWSRRLEKIPPPTADHRRWRWLIPWR